MNFNKARKQMIIETSIINKHRNDNILKESFNTQKVAKIIDDVLVGEEFDNYNDFLSKCDDKLKTYVKNELGLDYKSREGVRYHQFAVDYSRKVWEEESGPMDDGYWN